jgi:hypothetical protein
MNIYEYLEDFDDNTLTDWEWEENMREAISLYMEDYPDTPPMKFKNRIRNYQFWRRERNPILNENYE